jgi:excisionase family DNA binding protein
MNRKTNDGRVSVKELAALLKVSTDTIRRAYRRGELPAIRVKTALRFDLDEVKRCMQRKGQEWRSAAAGAARPPQSAAARPPNAPVLVTRGLG